MAQLKHPELVQIWVHSHEEDNPDQAVYRREGFAFPPARGRRGFHLKPDGTMTEFGPGPTDRTASRQGRWEIGNDQRLAFYPDDSNTPARLMKVASLTPEKLVLERVEPER